MKHSTFIIPLIILVVLTTPGCMEERSEAAPVVNNAQSVSGISPQQAVEAWDRMASMVIETAKLMPAENYSFTPSDPVRVFSDQINHTAGANYLFAAVVKKERPDVAVEGADKEQVVHDLEASFAFIEEGLSQLTPSDLNEEMEWFGRSMSRLQAILTMTDHLQREHGKTIMYLRAKGVAPAQSAGW